MIHHLYLCVNPAFWNKLLLTFWHLTLLGVTQEFRIVKDNRIKLKEVSETLPEASQNGDSSNECAFSNVKDKR